MAKAKEVTGKGKGKALAVKGKGKGKVKASTGKTKSLSSLDDSGNAGRRSRKKSHVLQFFDVSAVDAEADGDDGNDSDEEEDFDSDFLDDVGTDAKHKNESGKCHNLPFLVKEEDLSGDELENIIKQRYGPNSEYVVYAEECQDIKGGDDGESTNSMNPTIWRVKCMVGREREIAFCLIQKYVDLQVLGTKLQIISVFSLEHMKGYIYIEAERECDITEACKGFCNIYLSRRALVPKNELPHLLSVREKVSEVSKGKWVRVKSGRYKGDLAKVVAVDDSRKRATIKLIPRIDLQAIANKFGGGVTLKKFPVPAPRFLSANELEDFRSHIQWRRDRDTGEVFEILDGLMLKGGYLYKKVSIGSLNYYDIQPSTDELQKFNFAKKDVSEDSDWLSLLYGGKEKRRPRESDKCNSKAVASTSENKEGDSFDLQDLVLLGKKDFGVIVGMEKDSFQILKGDNEKSEIVTVSLHEIKSGCCDKNFTAPDCNMNSISINDRVRVMDGPYKGREGIAKHLYKGSIFIYDDNELENSGIFCAKSGLCEKIKYNKIKDASEKHADDKSGRPGFQDPTASPTNPQSPRGATQEESIRGFNSHSRGDRDQTFSIGQTLRIRVGPLKGFLCRVIAIYRSDVKVKLQSQMKVITVKSEHLSEAGVKSFRESALSDFGNPASFSTSQPFDQFETKERPSDDGSGWDFKLPTTRDSWKDFSASGFSLGSSDKACNDTWNKATNQPDGSNEATESWDKAVGPSVNQSSSWGKATAGDSASGSVTDQAGAWDKNASMNQNTSWGKSTAGGSSSWGKSTAGDSATGSVEDQAGTWDKNASMNQNSSWGKSTAGDSSSWGKSTTGDSVSGAVKDQAGAWDKNASTNQNSSWGKSTAGGCSSWGKSTARDSASGPVKDQAGGGYKNASMNQNSSWGKSIAGDSASGAVKDQAGGWDKSASMNQNSSWGKAAAEDSASGSVKDQDGSWDKNENTNQNSSWGKSTAADGASGAVKDQAGPWDKSASKNQNTSWGKATSRDGATGVVKDQAGSWEKNASTNPNSSWGKSTAGDGASGAVKGQAGAWDKNASTNQNSSWGKSTAGNSSSWGKSTAGDSASGPVKDQTGAWDKSASKNQNLAWGKSTAGDGATGAVKDQAGTWDKSADGWDNATVRTGHASSVSGSWGKAKLPSEYHAGDGWGDRKLKNGNQADSSNNTCSWKNPDGASGNQADCWKNEGTAGGSQIGGWDNAAGNWNKAKGGGWGEGKPDKWGVAKNTSEGETKTWNKVGSAIEGETNSWNRSKSFGGDRGSSWNKGADANDETGEGEAGGWNRSKSFDGGQGSGWNRGGRGGGGNRDQGDSWNRGRGYGGGNRDEGDGGNIGRGRGRGYAGNRDEGDGGNRGRGFGGGNRDEDGGNRGRGFGGYGGGNGDEGDGGNRGRGRGRGYDGNRDDGDGGNRGRGYGGYGGGNGDEGDGGNRGRGYGGRRGGRSFGRGRSSGWSEDQQGSWNDKNGAFSVNRSSGWNNDQSESGRFGRNDSSGWRQGSVANEEKTWGSKDNQEGGWNSRRNTSGGDQPLSKPKAFGDDNGSGWNQRNTFGKEVPGSGGNWNGGKCFGGDKPSNWNKDLADDRDGDKGGWTNNTSNWNTSKGSGKKQSGGWNQGSSAKEEAGRDMDQGEGSNIRSPSGWGQTSGWKSSVKDADGGKGAGGNLSGGWSQRAATNEVEGGNFDKADGWKVGTDSNKGSVGIGAQGCWNKRRFSNNEGGEDRPDKWNKINSFDGGQKSGWNKAGGSNDAEKSWNQGFEGKPPTKDSEENTDQAGGWNQVKSFYGNRGTGWNTTGLTGSNKEDRNLGQAGGWDRGKSMDESSWHNAPVQAKEAGNSGASSWKQGTATEKGGGSGDQADCWGKAASTWGKPGGGSGGKGAW